MEARKRMLRANSSFGVAATGDDMYIRVDKISGEVPADVFDFPQGCAVYAADTGEISDLLGEPKLVEQH